MIEFFRKYWILSAIGGLITTSLAVSFFRSMPDADELSFKNYMANGQQELQAELEATQSELAAIKQMMADQASSVPSGQSELISAGLADIAILQDELITVEDELRLQLAYQLYFEAEQSAHSRGDATLTLAQVVKELEHRSYALTQKRNGLIDPSSTDQIESLAGQLIEAQAMIDLLAMLAKGRGPSVAKADMKELPIMFRNLSDSLATLGQSGVTPTQITTVTREQQSEEGPHGVASR